MNYTRNYHLPQWVKSDRVMMDDFNDAMSALETGLTNAQAAADSARSAASSAASTAQSAANAARQKPYAVGSYTGTGQDVTINLGFRPSFVIVSGCKESADQNSLQPFSRYGCVAGGNILPNTFTFTSSGFVVHAGQTRCPRMGESGRVYDYIAFK